MSRATGQGAAHRLPSLFPLRPGLFKFGMHSLILEQSRWTRQSDLARHHLLCGPQKCIGEKSRFFADCAPQFGLRALTGYKLYQLFASVGVRRDWSSVNALASCGGSLFSISNESAEDLDYGAHNVVVRIRTRLQVNSDVSDKCCGVVVA